LLSHPHAETLVAGLLRSHFAERTESAEELAARRRAKNPPPAPTTEEEAPVRRRRRKRGGASSEQGDRGDAHPEGDTSGSRRREDQSGTPHEAASERTNRQGPRKDDADSEPEDDRDTAEVYVNVGRRDGARPEHFQALLDASGLGDSTEYVHVRQRHAFVGVPRELVERAIAAIQGASISGKEATAEEARRPGD
jgi:ATP-dependent RNA helicase DeaD